MTERLTLMAEPRTVLGKQVSRLRRDGKVPGVVYGPEIEGTIQVQVDRKEFERFYMNYGLEVPFTLRWGSGSRRVVIREVQMDNVKRAPLHIDFYAPKR
jgi:large subunit ribosomal protein L25